MTKEELIALSDLNREDNIKYISSEAQGIAIALDSDRYAPTLCKLERAYICGRRKSEEQIAELKAQIEKMKEVISELIAITDEDICKECDGGIHCSECYVNHAQTYASHFINEKEMKEK